VLIFAKDKISARGDQEMMASAGRIIDTLLRSGSGPELP